MVAVIYSVRNEGEGGGEGGERGREVYERWDKGGGGKNWGPAKSMTGPGYKGHKTWELQLRPSTHLPCSPSQFLTYHSFIFRFR